MVKSVLEKYYQKKWLECRCSVFSAQERLWAGYRFFNSYVQSHSMSFGVVDFTKPFVDGGRFENSLESNLKEKEKFLKAYRSIPLECRKTIEMIVLDNKEPKATRHDLIFLRQMLCTALDALVVFYAGLKEGKDEQQ